MNKTGKTITIFLGLIVVLLVSTASISIFLLNKETEKRKAVEVALNDAQGTVNRLQGDLKVAQNKAFVLEEKNKEADARINSLEEELDVEKGLKEAMKSENAKLKEDLDASTADLDRIQTELNGQLLSFQEKAKVAEQELVARDTKVKDLEAKVSETEKKLAEVTAEIEKAKAAAAQAPAGDSSEIKDQQDQPVDPSAQKGVELEPIVVNATDTVKGRVLSVDKETEFLIFDLGAISGVKQGDVMSVMRGNNYLGDIKVSRVQDEMSAADLIPPFSSRMVRKNDTVVPKQ